MKNKAIALSAALGLFISLASCNSEKSSSEPSEPSTTVLTTTQTEPETLPDMAKYQYYSALEIDEIVSSLTIEQKAAQMVLPQIMSISEEDMELNDYGGILSQDGHLNAEQWRETVDSYQQSAVDSAAGIPLIYGQDDVHGVNYCSGAVIFPHNIGLGAANDEELIYQAGLITADEAKLCHMLWNFAPCVAQSKDPRWGRTYESFGADLDTIKRLSAAYTKGLIDGGVIACPKHFIADGNAKFGTGEDSDVKRLIDRGDASISDATIEELMKVYQAQIDAGAQTIMVSHSSLNGVKMHENGEYIMRLKDEMGFTGFIVSDWNSVQNTSADTYEEQVVNAVNAGIDMLMEVDDFEKARMIIVDAVKNGTITEERVDDAVSRIIGVKIKAGIFEDPFCENMETKQTETGSQEYREVAEKLVEESLVMLKNDDKTLPFEEGTSVYITGPAADNAQAQCGGWTVDWNSSPDTDIEGVTTILDGFIEKADEYGINVITDEDEAENADVVLLAVGEKSYAEWLGDTEDMELCGKLGLKGNANAIKKVQELGKPVVTCIVAGRQVIIDKDNYDSWNSVVMCYLPGSEGQGIADVLCGGADFKGKLPSPWYSSTEQIGTDDCWFKPGTGLTY